jgi:hypothetical protein
LRAKELTSVLGLLFTLTLFFGSTRHAFAESQDSNEYKGITDPFGDPANYEFSDDEKEDKEFFHLGRYFQIGVDMGAGIFTGGLGQTTSPGFYFGVHVVYFFDRSLALELGAHFADHLDSIRPSTGQTADIDTQVIPVTAGLRYYFDTKDAPKAIAAANPYLVVGIGSYFRIQTVLDNTLNVPLNNANTANFGAFGGGGLEFNIYKKHIFLGVDARFHYVMWTDQNDTFGGLLQPGARAGDYVTTVITLTYSF